MRAPSRDYRAEVAQLDSLSRTRALTDAESLLLERYLGRLGPKPKRAPVGNTKELARQGIKRRHADRQVRQVWCDQCSRTVRVLEAERCSRAFCKAKLLINSVGKSQWMAWRPTPAGSIES